MEMWPETTTELAIWTLAGTLGLLVAIKKYEGPGTMEGWEAFWTAFSGAIGFMAAAISLYVGLAQMWPTGLLVLFSIGLPVWFLMLTKGWHGPAAVVIGITWLCALTVYIGIVT